LGEDEPPASVAVASLQKLAATEVLFSRSADRQARFTNVAVR